MTKLIEIVSDITDMIPSFVDFATDENSMEFCAMWLSFAYSTLSSLQMTVKAAPLRGFGRANCPMSAYIIFPI